MIETVITAADGLLPRARGREMKMKRRVTLLLLLFTLLTLLSLSFLNPNPNPKSLAAGDLPRRRDRLRVLVADIPRRFNYGLLDLYWSLTTPDSRSPSDPDHPRSNRHRQVYPENPLIKQYSAEYWLLGDLEAPTAKRENSAAERVYSAKEGDYDVVFVPFFATLSAEMELGWGKKGGFNKKEGNEDYRRQREVMDLVKASDTWRRSGGRDHVFVLTGNCMKIIQIFCASYNVCSELPLIKMQLVLPAQ